MRRRFFRLMVATLAAVGLSLGAATAASASDVPSLSSCSSQLLVMGSQGDCVRSLQHNLDALGFGLKQDGQYGPRTRLAVVYYQTWAGIQVDGMAGPQTMSNLDLDANRPAPAGRGSIPAMPDNSAVFAPNGSGVMVDGMASSSSYFGRVATRQLNDTVGSAGAGWLTGEAGGAFCTAMGVVWGAAAGPAGGKLAGAACGQAVAAEAFNIQEQLQLATAEGGCFEIKSYIFPTQYVIFTTNNGHNCIP
jgi:peptidoglycan hydrolase-like protein with peptidoglycan-binding domain